MRCSIRRVAALSGWPWHRCTKRSPQLRFPKTSPSLRKLRSKSSGKRHVLLGSKGTESRGGHCLLQCRERMSKDSCAGKTGFCTPRLLLLTADHLQLSPNNTQYISTHHHTTTKFPASDRLPINRHLPDGSPSHDPAARSQYVPSSCPTLSQDPEMSRMQLFTSLRT